MRDGNLINVNVYGVEASVLYKLKDELLEMGYKLNFDPQSILNTSTTDICIVDRSHIDDCLHVLEQDRVPYLISGINMSKPPSEESDFPVGVLRHSVGFINGMPGLTDICISIQLGLLWHEERQKYSQRVQDIDEKIHNNRTTGVAIGMLISQSGLLEKDVMSCLKSTSRDKRRRMVDVSDEIIANNKLLDNADISTQEKLNLWLDSAISNRTRCVES